MVFLGKSVMASIRETQPWQTTWTLGQAVPALELCEVRAHVAQGYLRASVMDQLLSLLTQALPTLSMGVGPRVTL